ncbi:MAG: flagellar basal body protein, partial [Arthrobacter sp.]|nr:flagellar basal body protein [Arthrobacter sp.]
MSTFGALNTAYRGLTAAQQGMNVAGQNIANAATEGYTRQRVEQSSLAAPARGLFSGGAIQPGQGVSVDAIARLGNSFLDSGVRSTSAQAGYAGVRSTALQGIEGVLQEPGDNGISTSLQEFWSAWQGAANQPAEDGPKGLLLNAANSVTDKISSAYQALQGQWSGVRAQASDAVDAVNAAATQVAAYNATIR